MSSTKKLSMLVVSQYYYPEQFRINDMCEEWVKRGYDVTVVTGIPNYPQGKFFDGYGWFRRRKEVHNGVDIIRLPIISRGKSKMRLGMNYLSFVVSGFFWKLLTRQRADFVFAFEVSPMTQVLPAVWFAKRLKIPCIAYIQDLWPENFTEMTGIEGGAIIRAINRMTDYIYGNCQRILVTSNSFKHTVKARGVPAEKVEFWPQYSEDFYKPSDIVSLLVSKDDRFTVAFTGNIGFSQGLETLPLAAKLLKSRSEKVRFMIVGAGRGLDSLKRTIQEHEVSDYFLFIPQQPPDKIPELLSAADAAYISFAKSDLFGKTIPAKLQSYMSTGMPILASATGETKAIIEESGCGFVCETGNVEELVDIIVRLKEMNRLDRSKLAANSIGYARMFFSKSKLMDRFDKIVGELLSVQKTSMEHL